ncbi:methyl-accepting chemotaxis protein (plasmid) [Phormidium sp. CLA17]|uniref:methyl-accepting chemotaxis protein n=1 Tax=Leptolyngbya sp. Cla-17 TaxID=2803751 RepID=UPI001491C750|nr:CHASE3 domain-containing protein [Leptolyngbya sp. Cla-17]MBM0745601.1 methyl-accepting chemotaxis protein [Leptolyngbya sp. Cla-17]
MKRGIKISQLVPIGFGIIVALTAASSLISRSATNTLIDSVDWVTHTYAVKAQLKDLEKTLVDAETGQRGFLFVNQESYLEPFNSASQKLRDNFSQLRDKIKDNPKQIERLSVVENLAQQKMEELEATINLRKAGKEKDVKALVLSGKGKQLMDDIRNRLAEMVKVEEQLLAERQQVSTQAQNLTTVVSWTSILAVVVIGAGTSVIITQILRRVLSKVVTLAEKVSVGDLTTQVEVTSNDEIGRLMAALGAMTQNLNGLVRQVQQSGIQVTTSTTQIAASGKQLEATLTEQVASTTQVSVTAKEIAATASELAKTMEAVVATAQSTTTAADNGQQGLRQMEATMRQLATSTTSISAKLGTMSEKANNINTVVTTITKVADQTNLLSLNAAIEAEKAGEYGLGFAVVAREIRRLADQTAVATLDIEQMVKEMQSAVSTGVMEMDKFTREMDRGVEDVGTIGTQVAEVIEQVQALTPQFAQVNEGMEMQSQGAQQISEAMMQLGEASRQTATSLSETNTAIAQLTGTAQGLRQEISRFKVSTG